MVPVILLVESRVTHSKPCPYSRLCFAEPWINLGSDGIRPLSSEDTETYTVRLKFEPAGRAVGEVGKYYQTVKQNQCLVCGRKDVYIRKNVVHSTKHEIPEERKKHLQRIVLDAYPEESEITEELLKRAYVETIKINENYCAHGSQVVKDSAGGLIELGKLWRTHFLNTMKPKYLPDLWSVPHNAHRLDIRAKEGRIDAEDMIVAGLDPSTLNVEAHPDKEIDANTSMQNHEQHSL